MLFSLNLPSRKRVACLIRLCESVMRTTHDLSNIEMHVACDDDDTETKKAKLDYPFLTIHYRPRVANHSAYHNWLLPFSSGKYICILNDDVEFLTPDWDVIAKEKLDAYPDIVYGRTGTNTGWSEFPFVSRIAVERLGYVLSERQPGHSADSYIYSVYSFANCICDLPEISFNHCGITDGGDETHDNMMFLSRSGDTTGWQHDGKKLLGLIP